MKRAATENEVNLTTSFLHLLHRAGQRADELFTTTAEATGITARQLVVLAAIDAHPDCSQTTVVNATGIDRSTIAEMIRRMEARRLVRRKRSKQDSRAYVLTLTDQGQTTLAQATPLAANIDLAVEEVIGPKRRADFARTLMQIVAELEAKK